MEWNLNARGWGGWDVEVPKSLAISNDQNGNGGGAAGGDYSFLGFLDDEQEEGGLVLSGEAMVGLKLGRQVDGHDKCGIKVQEYSSYSPGKRSRASYQSGTLLPRCQVEGCNLDLASAKDYHRRHRICADHSKSPKVVVAGMECRFCQQCSRLHELSEFDERKRSCRRRLSAHNARRRRPQPEDMKLGSTHRRSHMDFLVNRITRIVSHNTTPQSSSSFKGGLSDISYSSFHGITPRRVNSHDGLEANSSSINAMEVNHSPALEATSSWGFRGHEEPPSFDQFIHGHNIGLMQPETSLEMQPTRNTQLPHDFDCF
ncbi:teosinte glume architecture 1-like [Bidens hawaiensis]|uniref:teosinte glume architecture 1-like n=1 Tax=Bidens hawaiensis TaxID=980011 RepID=UPI004049DA01